MLERFGCLWMLCPAGGFGVIVESHLRSQRIPASGRIPPFSVAAIQGHSVHAVNTWISNVTFQCLVFRKEPL